MEITRVPVSTKTVIGLIAGSDFHVDTNGDVYEVVTCVDAVTTETVEDTKPAKPTVTVTVLATADEAGNVSVDSAPGRDTDDTNEDDASEGTQTVYVTIVHTATLDVPKSEATSDSNGSDNEVPVPVIATEPTEPIAPGPAEPAGSPDSVEPAGSTEPAESTDSADSAGSVLPVPAPPADGPATPNQDGVVEVIQSPEDTVEITPAQANDASKLAVGIAMAFPLALVFL